MSLPNQRKKEGKQNDKRLEEAVDEVSNDKYFEKQQLEAAGNAKKKQRSYEINNI